MKRLSKEARARLHLCTVPGCNRVWVSDFGRGRVCGIHNQPEKSVVPVPSTEPVPSWHDTDTEEGDRA